MRVAAVIPHWNRRDLLEALLASLREQVRPFDEVVVADNGSTDDSAQIAERAGAVVLRLGRNLGFARAVNRAIEATQADWVAIMNNDVTLEQRWLVELLDAAEHGNAWFATGKILRTQDSSVLDGAFDEISRGACACRCGSGKADSPIWNEARPIRFAPMTAALFRRSLFDDVGLLDERFESYLEDMDFGFRCALAGREGMYVPAAIAHHRGSSTLGPWNSDTVWHISRNQVLLAAKYFRGQPRWPILVGQLLWGILALRHVQGIAYLRGKISGLKLARNLSSKPGRSCIEKVRAIAAGSENEILTLQRKGGFDWYWRAYFWLLRQ